MYQGGYTGLEGWEIPKELTSGGAKDEIFFGRWPQIDGWPERDMFTGTRPFFFLLGGLHCFFL
jgi:hypothetical protein